MKIQNEKYTVDYNPKLSCISFQGSLLLYGMEEYEPILALLKAAAVKEGVTQLTLDLATLKFLNSSGISMMTKFVIFLCDTKESDLEFQLNLVIKQGLHWQEKLAKNLTRLMPTLNISLKQAEV